MDEIKRFYKEREDVIKRYKSDPDLIKASEDLRRLSMEKRYVYNFDWLGRPIIQYPQDIVAFQEIVWKTKPDLIIETGIAHGGSLILSASMLALLDLSDSSETMRSEEQTIQKRKVIGIDIEIRDHNRRAIKEHPFSNRIEMLEGSSTDPSIIKEVGDIAKKYNRVMVCLDSLHTHEHVLEELEAYSKLVSKDCYCLVLDTLIEDLPSGFFKDRPWDKGNSPKTAVYQFLSKNPNFQVDEQIYDKLLISSAPSGFLKRIN